MKMSLTEQDIMEIGKNFLEERIKALQKEVSYCISYNEEIKEAVAPLSALLFHYLAEIREFYC